MKSSQRRIAPRIVLTSFTSLALLAGCGDGEGYYSDLDATDLDAPVELGEAEEALEASCGGDDSNSLAAGLAVAVAP
jgi:hypothetical protein